MNSGDSVFDVKTMEPLEPPQTSDDEDSFVVLEHSPSISESDHNASRDSPIGEVLPLFRTNKVREMKNLISTEISQISAAPEGEEPAADGLDTSSLRKIVFSAEWSYEEIQKHVEELIKDNEKLKSTIAQNNVNMKNQYGQFSKYKDEVAAVMKSYKEKFLEAKMCIETLKDENRKLTDDIEGYIHIKQLQEEEIIKLKEKITKLQGSDEGSHMADKIETMDELETELARAKLNITDLQTETEQLKNEVSNLNSTITNLEKTLKKSAEQYKSQEEQNAKLQAELSLKQQNIEKLTDRLVKSPNLEDQVESKVAEINVLQFDKTALIGTVNRLEKENGELKQKLVATVEDYEARRQQLDKMYDESIKNNERIARQFEDQLRGYQNARVSVEKDAALLKELQTKYPAVKEERNQLQAQLSIAQQTITELGMEQDRKVNEIEKLRKLLQDNENDELFALREQVALYKHDFEVEVESKNSLKRERDQIAEDLKNLQRRNQQLQNEVETVRARNQPQPEGYTCPKCSFGFSTYQALENHVHRCLDLEGFP